MPLCATPPEIVPTRKFYKFLIKLKRHIYPAGVICTGWRCVLLVGGCRVGGAGVCCVAVGVLVWVKIQVGTQEHTAGGCFVSDFL